MANLRNLARGMPCQVRVPGYCNFDPETTVLAHDNLSGLGGMGMKVPDLLAAHCCSRCHDVIDGRVKTQYSRDEIRLMFYEGMARTQNELIKAGVITW